LRKFQYQNGTIFGSSRGNFDVDKIINALRENGINQLYVIRGGDSHLKITALS
jgi:hypothetical protein